MNFLTSAFLSEIFPEMDLPMAQSIMRILVLMLIGLPLVFSLAAFVRRLTLRRSNEHTAMVLRKVIVYTGFVILLLLVMAELGFDLTALAATAGLATIAIGFAAQTSLSNLISGIFLLGEKPFQVGDLIRVGTHMGVVASIDLMSVKLRTLDNLFLRIPNETLLKTELTNITRFPIRRMDLIIRIPYETDPQRVMDLLKEVAQRNRYCMDEPEPLLLIKDFSEWSIDILFGVWFEKTQYVLTRNAMFTEIHQRFRAAGIPFAIPRQSVSWWSQGKSLSLDDPEHPAAAGDSP